MAVEALTRGIINKIMHTPITTLKSAARESSEVNDGHRSGAQAVRPARCEKGETRNRRPSAAGSRERDN